MFVNSSTEGRAGGGGSGQAGGTLGTRPLLTPPHGSRLREEAAKPVLKLIPTGPPLPPGSIRPMALPVAPHPDQQTWLCAQVRCMPCPEASPCGAQRVLSAGVPQGWHRDPARLSNRGGFTGQEQGRVLSWRVVTHLQPGVLLTWGHPILQGGLGHTSIQSLAATQRAASSSWLCLQHWLHGAHTGSPRPRLPTGRGPFSLLFFS